MDILIAFAVKKGWVTAKAGRPDINRAGNFSSSHSYISAAYTDLNFTPVLRMLAEGRIRWAFWPPDAPAKTFQVDHKPESGLWIPQGTEDYFEISDSDSDAGVWNDSEDEASQITFMGSDDEEDFNDSDGESTLVSMGMSRFAVLQVGADDDSDDGKDNLDYIETTYIGGGT